MPPFSLRCIVYTIKTAASIETMNILFLLSKLCFYNINVKTRNSNFEIAKVIATFLILVSHYCFCGVGSESINSLRGLTAQSFFFSILQLGSVGVVIFTIISGYFLINSTKVKLSKIITFILTVTLYSLIGYVIALGTKNGFNAFNSKTFVERIFSFFLNDYWFITAYVILYAIHPLLNKALKAHDGKNALLIAITLFIISILFSFFSRNELIPNYFRGTFSLAAIYSFGAYFYLNKDSSKITVKKGTIFIAISCLTTILIFVIILYISGTNPNVNNYAALFFTSKESPLSILLGFGILMICEKAKPTYNKTINYLSSFSLGTYLITCNKDLDRDIWNKIFRVDFHAFKPYFLVHVLVTIILAFIMCIIIENIKKFIVDKPIDLVAKKYKKKRA